MRRRSGALALAVAVLAGACSAGGGDGEAANDDVYRGPRLTGTAHPLGLKYDLRRSEQFAPYLGRLAGGGTFYMLVWCDVEAEPGTRDWAEPDRAVELASRLGYRMALHLRVGSCWATEGRVGEGRGRKQKTASALPADIDNYRSFIRAAVARYAARGVHDYSIENEVNAPAFWEGTPQEYERLVRVGAEEIRAADPEARVFDGGISSTAYGIGIAADLVDSGAEDLAVAAYGRYYLHRSSTRARDFPQISSAAGLRDALAGPQARRNLAFLESTFRLVEARVVDAYQLHFYEGAASVPDLLEYLQRQLPSGTEIEAWEVGMYRPDVPHEDREHADELARVVASLLGGGVRRVIYLPAAYDPTGRREREIRWGLLRPGGQPGAAAELYAMLARDFANAAFERIDADGLRGVVATRDGGVTAIVWSANGGVKVAPPPGAAAFDASGVEVPWPPAGLTVGERPLRTTFPGDAALARRVLSATGG